MIPVAPCSGDLRSSQARRSAIDLSPATVGTPPLQPGVAWPSCHVRARAGKAVKELGAAEEHGLPQMIKTGVISVDLRHLWSSFDLLTRSDARGTSSACSAPPRRSSRRPSSSEEGSRERRTPGARTIFPTFLGHVGAFAPVSLAEAHRLE